MHMYVYIDIHTYIYIYISNLSVIGGILNHPILANSTLIDVTHEGGAMAHCSSCACPSCGKHPKSRHWKSSGISRVLPEKKRCLFCRNVAQGRSELAFAVGHVTVERRVARNHLRGVQYGWHGVVSGLLSIGQGHLRSKNRFWMVLDPTDVGIWSLMSRYEKMFIAHSHSCCIKKTWMLHAHMLLW